MIDILTETETFDTIIGSNVKYRYSIFIWGMQYDHYYFRKPWLSSQVCFSFQWPPVLPMMSQLNVGSW